MHPEAGQMTAGASSGAPAAASRGLVRPRQGLITASAWGALLTGTVAIWVATELRTAGLGWLPWLACALPAAVAGAVCLARRRASSAAPAAVFASCAVAGAYAVQTPNGRNGLVLTAAVLLLLCAGVAVVVSAVVTAVLISISDAISRRRATVWTAAGLIFVALSIPSPVYFTGSPIQTIFAGNTGREDATTICYLVLLALPLVVAGLASARMAAVMAIAWLPAAAGQLLSSYIFQSNFLHLDAWYYASWLPWLAIAALTLAEARNWQSSTPDTPRADPDRS
jgi:hypothetical protein